MKIFAALCLSLIAAPVFASGTLDPTFADNGVKVMRFDEVNAEVADIHDFALDGLIDHQGRYVSVGYAIEATAEYPFVGQITRHLRSGERDLGLAGQGFLRFRYLPLWGTRFNAVAEYNGKIIVGGYTDIGDDMMNPYNSSLVCRFEQTGETDPSFGGDSFSDHPGCRSYGELFSWGESSVIDMQILGEGKILLLIKTRAEGNSSYALVRLTADGALDQTFGDGNCPACGYVLSPASLGTLVHPVAFAAEEAHGIVVALDFSLAGNQDMAVVYHKIDGGMENGFSYDGKVSVGFDELFKDQTGETGGTSDVPAGIGFLDDGSILIGGTLTPKGVAAENPERHSAIGVVKFRPDGELDESFGIEGRFFSRYDIITGSYASSLKIQSDGKIILAGRCNVCANFNVEKFAVTRILSDGSAIDKGWAIPSSFFDSTLISVDDADSYYTNGYDTVNGSSAIALEKGHVVVFGWSKKSNFASPSVINPHIVRLELDDMFSDSFDF